MKKIFFTFFYSFISLFVYSFIAPRAFAAGEFRADYTVQYSISPAGTTIVTQNIALTNKLSNLYPKKYAILIDSVRLKNIIAYDGGGPIVPTISQKDGKTEILLTFNEKVVGLGKTMQFTLRFENGDIAQKNGSIWEVNIPGVTDDPDIGSYSVNLSTPASFGPNAYMVPAPAAGNTWTREQLTRGGVSAAYGTRQFFSVALSYHLENPGVTPSTAHIALPPDTAYQTITVSEITPKPATVTSDADGNWLAQYQLAPNASVDVTVYANAEVTLSPKEGYRQFINPNEYLVANQYWETQNPQIISLANQYRTPREIYDYVVATLSYDERRVKQNPIRKGAVAALATPLNSLCMEFTDLFVAIARAAGIPSREVVGYAYTNNATLRPLSFVADVLHAWPEYYDTASGIWVPVDPTWGRTTGGINYFDKLDFNHVTFVMHGKSSTTPLPPGSYRKEGKQGKDVVVGFAQSPPSAAAAALATTVVFPKKITAGIPQQGSVVIENNGQAAATNISVSLQSTPVSVTYDKTYPLLPPYGTITIPLNLTVPAPAGTNRGSIAVRVNDATTTGFFDIAPTYLSFVPLALVLAVAAAIAVLWKIFRRR